MSEPTSSAVCKSRRMQSMVDVFMSVLIAMLVWPFPVARAMLTPTVHVAGVLATCVIAQLLYYGISAAVWHQTLGMRVADIHLNSADRSPLTRLQGVQWGITSAVVAPWFVAAPKSACSAAVAERVSRTTVY